MNLTLTRASQISQLIRRGGNILVAILLAKTHLPPAEIGVYETLTFLCSIADFFWLNALLQTGLSYFPTLSEVEKPKFIFQQFLIFNLFSFALFCIFIFFKSKLLLVLTGQSELPFYGIYWYFLLFHFPSFLIESNYLLQQNAKALLSYTMITFVLQQILFFYPILTHLDFKYSFYGLVIFGILKYIWLIINVLQTKRGREKSFQREQILKNDFFCKKKSFFKICSLYPCSRGGAFLTNLICGNIRVSNRNLKSYFPAITKNYLILALPLMGYAALNGLAMNFDGILINWFYKGDKTIFALYRYGARELPITLALSIGLSNALVPLIATNCAEGLYALKQKSKRLWHTLFPLSILLLLTSHYWYPKVFRAEFAQSAAIFDIYLLLIISRLLFSNTILIALNETNVLLKISVVETILNILLSIVGIYCFGFVGVAGATVIAYWFEKVAIAIYLKRNHRIHFSDYSDKNWYMLYVSILLITYLVKHCF